jgi:hypothetical protein
MGAVVFVHSDDAPVMTRRNERGAFALMHDDSERSAAVNFLRVNVVWDSK